MWGKVKKKWAKTHYFPFKLASREQEKANIIDLQKIVTSYNS